MFRGLCFIPKLPPNPYFDLDLAAEANKRLGSQMVCRSRILVVALLLGLLSCHLLAGTRRASKKIGRSNGKGKDLASQGSSKSKKKSTKKSRVAKKKEKGKNSASRPVSRVRARKKQKEKGKKPASYPVSSVGAKHVKSQRDNAIEKGNPISGWVRRFCSLPEHGGFYLEVPRAFIEDPLTSAAIREGLGTYMQHPG